MTTKPITKILILLIIFSFHFSHAQNPFNKGVNLTNWFQANGPKQIPFTKYTKEDFKNIKSLGCDVIRLPINLHFMTNGSPDYKLDPLFLSFLDEAVNWAEELQINLILDNHTFDPAVNTDPNVGTVLTKVWKQMAEHYKERSNYIYYEVLNEPHGPSTASWGQTQQSVITAIRSVDTKHTIVVGASSWNTYTELKNLPVYSDNNLIYTFHFYDPFIFTHQGASWTDPSMVPLANVPFPYDESKMPLCPASLSGTWICNEVSSGYKTNGTVAKVKQMIDIAVDFKNTRNVKIYCGEFGVYIPNSDNLERTYWYDVVRKYMEEKGIPWTMWDYQGGFGLFEKGSSEFFDYDVNLPLVSALGLIAPEQKEYVLKPDSVPFEIYGDYAGKQMVQSGDGDFYSTSQPNNGNHCLYWTNANRYTAVGLDMRPDKDLSKLVEENYALDFFIRGDTSEIKFDLRFLDSKVNDSDHPWRMNYTIDDTKVNWDKKWHHLHIPLKDFFEGGSWDNNAWFNAEGKFDWKAIDRLEIVAENSNLTDKKLWFDNIYITNLDTAKVWNNSVWIEQVKEEEEVTGIKDKGKSGLLEIYPNPVTKESFIHYSIPQTGEVQINVFSITGEKVFSVLSAFKVKGEYTVKWNEKHNKLKPGLYVLKITSPGLSETKKIVVGNIN